MLRLKRSIKIDYISLVIFTMFLCLILEQNFHISSFIYFSVDILIAVLLLPVLIMKRKCLKEKSICMIVLIFLTAIVITNIRSVTQKVNLANILFGNYRYLRGPLFFFCCAAYLNETRIKSTLTIIKIIFWINVFITLFQFFILGYRQDLLGGVFGTTVGVNQYTNLLFVTITVFIIPQWLNKKIKTYSMLVYSFWMLLIAALAEIKFFFIEYMVAILVGFILVKKDIKTIWKFTFGVLISIIGMILVVKLFPEFSGLFQLFTSVKGINRLMKLQTHYSTYNDMGRFGAFGIINANYFRTFQERLFGYGLGKCLWSSLVDNSFFIENSSTHYDQFMTAYLYFEQGIAGTVLYISTLLIPLLKGIQLTIIKKNPEIGILQAIAAVMALCCYIYNMSLYGNCCFLIYFILAIPYRKEKDDKS